jgi:hypothetical protein
MFTEEELNEVKTLVDGLLDGNRGVYHGVQEELSRMIDERDHQAIPGIMAIIVSLLPPEAQSRLRFGAS